MSPRKTFLVVSSIAGILFLLVLLTYLFPFLMETRNPGISSETPTPVAAVSGDEKPDMVIQPFTRTITVKGKNELEITAERAEIRQGRENSFVLRNIERAVFYGNDGRKYHVSAEEGQWNELERKVRISGDVKCRIEGDPEELLEIFCGWLEYDSNIRIIDGGGQVRLVQGPYQAEGDNIAVNLKLNVVTLDGKVRTQILPEGLKQAHFQTDEPIIINARKAKYYHDVRVLEYMGSPFVRFGSNSLKAGTLTLMLGAEPEIISRMNVEMILTQSSRQMEGPVAPIRISATQLKTNFKSGEVIFWGSVQMKQLDRTLSAETIRVQMNDSGNEIIGILAEREVYYRENDLAGMADRAIYNRTDGLLMMTGNAQITQGTDNKVMANVIQVFPSQKYYIAEQDVDLSVRLPMDQPAPHAGDRGSADLFAIQAFQPGSLLTAKCDRVEFDESLGLISLTGQVQGKQDEYRFGADGITVKIDPEVRLLTEVTGEGNVNITHGEDIITSDRLIYDRATQKSTLTGHCTAFHQNDQLRSDSMIVHHADQLIEMKGNVIVLIHNVAQSNLHLPLETTPQGNTPESIRIQADEGMFDQEKSEADFKGHTIVIWQAWNIQSNQIHIGFDPVSKQMQSAIAEGQVVMKQNDFNATGATLTYSAEQSIIKLTGSETEKARVWRGERGSEAEQITFFVNEHRYQIEDGLSVVMPGELTESIK